MSARDPRGRAATRRGARPVIDDAIVQALLPLNREPEVEDREAALVNARLWHAAGLSPSTVRAWLRAGAYPDEAALVTALLTEGIAHDRGAEVVTHPDTGERMTVLDLARCEYQPFRQQALRDVLDAAQVTRESLPFRWWTSPGA